MILHVDMDAFFAAVEIRDRPELRDLPVAVGGGAVRGVISAASYAARKFGVHSAMPTKIALRRCPQLVLIPPTFAKYVEASAQIHTIFSRYTPLIEPLSLDEAFLDVSASEHIFGSAMAIGKRIKWDIENELELTASVGIAETKFVAKIASDIKKPNALVQVLAGQEIAFLDPLPVSRLWGIGKVTEARCHQIGLITIQQVRQSDPKILENIFGNNGQRIWQLAHGVDERPVRDTRNAQSISQETTFPTDIKQHRLLLPVLMDLTEIVAFRLRKNKQYARTIDIKVRAENFQTFTRAHTLPQETNQTQILWRGIKSLFDDFSKRHATMAIRLVGVGVTKLENDSAGIQADLFNIVEEISKIDKLTDDINNRFGARSIIRGLNRSIKHH